MACLSKYLSVVYCASESCDNVVGYAMPSENTQETSVLCISCALNVAAFERDLDPHEIGAYQIVREGEWYKASISSTLALTTGGKEVATSRPVSEAKKKLEKDADDFFAALGGKLK